MKFINLHTHSFSNDDTILEVVNQYPWEFNEEIPQYSIGIHPWFIDKSRLNKDLKTIEEKVSLKECLALGECGLDKRIDMPLDEQINALKMQLDLVQRTDKPIILHCVAAYQEIIEIKKEMNIQNPMIIHGFSKNIQVAKSLLDNGFYLSFGKYLMRNQDLENVFKFVPIDNIFLETDTTMESVLDVYQKAASLKNIELSKLKKTILDNYENVFGFKP